MLTDVHFEFSSSKKPSIRVFSKGKSIQNKGFDIEILIFDTIPNTRDHSNRQISIKMQNELMLINQLKFSFKPNTFIEYFLNLFSCNF